MNVEDELNRNDIVTCWREAGYHIVVNPDAGEDTLGRPLVTIKKIMTTKLLKRIAKHSYDELKMSINPVPREKMLAMLEKGRKRLDNAETLIRGYQV